jgi:diacylglycerol kinase (ATP)
VWTGLRHVGDPTRPVRIRVDGRTWFKGRASCVLFGNVGTVAGGLRLFDDARPDDGWLDVGVATAEGAVQWARTLGRAAVGHADRSPFVRTTRGRAIEVRLGAPMAYELDGGERDPASRLKVRLVRDAVTVCVPSGGTG